MKQRSVAAVILLGLTGIYLIIWHIKTKNEMNRMGTDVPSGWWWLTFIFVIPAFWWHWRYAKAVEHVTRGKLSTVVSYVLILFISPIAQGIIQSDFNKLAASARIPSARALG